MAGHPKAGTLPPMEAIFQPLKGGKRLGFVACFILIW